MDELAFLELGSVTAAQALLGWRFYHREPTGLVGGIIVETEAYTQEDAASHSFRGKTPRTEIMFGPAGYLYVYFTYGMHYCVNIVTGKEGHGEAVLLRALVPDNGIDTIRERRNYRSDSELTDGPAKICQALRIDKTVSGTRLNDTDFLLLPPERPVTALLPTQRIGITKDTHRLWRFTAEL